LKNFQHATKPDRHNTDLTAPWTYQHRGLVATVAAGVGCVTQPQFCAGFQMSASAVRAQQRGMKGLKQSLTDATLTYATLGLVSGPGNWAEESVPEATFGTIMRYADGARIPWAVAATRGGLGLLTDAVAAAGCIAAKATSRGC
jgi:hypothetical protein